MANWVETIDVREFFKSSSEDTFETDRDGIVSALKNSRWYREYQDKPGKPSLRICVNELSRAETLEDFNYYWNLLYSLADRDRRLIKT